MNDASNSSSEKSSAIAVLLSFLITGAGQLYAGQTERGTIMLIAYFILWVLSGMTGILFLVLIIYWIWGMADASAQVIQMREQKEAMIEEETKRAEEEEKDSLKYISSEEFVSQLRRLTKLHDAGLLNDDEIEAKKKALFLVLSEKEIREDVEDFLAALIPSIERDDLSREDIDRIKKLLL